MTDRPMLVPEDVPRPGAYYRVVGSGHSKRRHYGGWYGKGTACVTWWKVERIPDDELADWPVCGRCAAMYRRER